MQIPDAIGYVVGYRAWMVNSETSYLHPIVNDPGPWLPRQAYEAYCMRPEMQAWASVFSIDMRHKEPPVDDCGCGIHAAKTIDGAKEYILNYRSECTRVFGRVKLWGTIIEGTEGYRASRAYPDDIVVLTSATRPAVITKGVAQYKYEWNLSEPNELAKKLFEMYGVPVKVISGGSEISIRRQLREIYGE